MKKKRKKIKDSAPLCPKCKSVDLNFMPWLGLIYQCRKCGWRGPLVVSKKKRISRNRTV